jgi:hypothetical protein
MSTVERSPRRTAGSENGALFVLTYSMSCRKESSLSTFRLSGRDASSEAGNECMTASRSPLETCSRWLPMSGVIFSSTSRKNGLAPQ